MRRIRFLGGVGANNTSRTSRGKPTVRATTARLAQMCRNSKNNSSTSSTMQHARTTSRVESSRVSKGGAGADCISATHGHLPPPPPPSPRPICIYFKYFTAKSCCLRDSSPAWRPHAHTVHAQDASAIQQPPPPAPKQKQQQSFCPAYRFRQTMGGGWPDPPPPPVPPPLYQTNKRKTSHAPRTVTHIFFKNARAFHPPS